MADTGGIQFDPQHFASLSSSAETKRRGPLTAGLVAGARDLQGYAGTVAQGAGQYFGLPSLANFGGQVATDAQTASAAQRPDLQTAPWREGGAPVVPWLEYNVARQVPLLATYLLAGKLTPQSLVPKELERLGASAPRVLGGGGLKAGADFATRRAAVEAGRDFGKSVVGAEIAGMPVAFASMYQEAQNKPGGATESDITKAAALSPIYAALDAVEPAQFKGLLKRGLEGGIVKRVATAGLVGAAAEVPQEGVQTALEQSFRPDLSTRDKLTNIVDAAVTGGVVGGVFGGVGGIRAMKRANPGEITTDNLNEVVSQVLSLPAPSMAVDAAGRASFDANELRATPMDVGPSASDRVVNSYLQPNFPEMIESQTIIQPKTGSLRWAKAYEQGLPDRPYGIAPQPELEMHARVMQNYLAQREGQPLNERDQKVADQFKLVQDELAFRNRINGSAINDNIPSAAVGAVERKSDVSGGSAANVSAAPASTSPTWKQQRDDLLKGVSTRKSYIDTENIDALKSTLIARLEKGSAAKGDLVLADRLGVDLNEPAKVAATSAGTQGQAGTQTTVAGDFVNSLNKTAPAAPANAEGGDQSVDPEFQHQWLTMLNKRRGTAIKALRDNLAPNRAVAQRQLFDALGAVSDRDTRTDGYKGLTELAKLVGVHNEEGQLTDEGVAVARQALPLELTVKAAQDQGYTGAEASAFDRGARGERNIKLGSLTELKAYNDGRDWALNRNAKTSPIPDTAPESETEDELNKLQGNMVRSAEIPSRQKDMQFLNQAIDQVYDSTLKPQEQAQLKRMAREGATGAEIDEVARYFASGRGALVQEQPPAKPFKGVVVDRGPLIRARERARAATEAAQDEAIQQLKVRQSIPEMEGLRDEFIQRQKRRQIIRDYLQKLSEERDAEQAQQGEVPELGPDTLKYRRGAGGGMTSTEVADHVREIVKGWKGKTDIEVHQSVEDLPDDVQRAVIRDGAEDAYGFVHNNTIHLIANNIPNAETAAATIYHEALGHLGLQRMFHAQLDNAMTSLYHGNENLKSLVDTWRNANPNAYGGSLARATEEVLAEMSERGTIEASWLSKIGAIVKAFARRMGLDLKVSDNELRAIMAMAHDQTIYGKEKESRTVKGLRYMLQLWHGSPHDFDRFLTDKISTGEGAQVYGWGLYFASIKDVAESYRDNLSDIGPPKVNGQDPHVWVIEHSPRDEDGKPILRGEEIYAISRQATYMARNSGVWRDLRQEYDRDWMDARREAREYMDAVYQGSRVKDPDFERAQERKIKRARAAIDTLDALHDAKPRGESSGKLYNVNVKALHDQFLDWFKPLTEQSDYVKSALKKMGVWPDEAEIKAAVARRDIVQQRYNRILANAKKQLGITATPTNGEVTTRDQQLALMSMVSRAVEDLRQAENAVPYGPDQLTGADVYHQLRARMGLVPDWPGFNDSPARRTSEMLLDAGIRGNRYVDQFSRGSAEGSYNYVVFSHDDIEIAAKYKRPDELNTAARQTIKTIIGKADDLTGREAVAGKVRSLTLGWTSLHGANEFYGKWFDRKDGQGNVVANGAEGYETALNEKNAIVARMAQMLTDVRDAFGALQSSNKNSAEKIVQLMRMSEFGINPTRPWKEQSEKIRTSPNKANLERLTNEAHNVYRSLLGRGHAGIYTDLRNVNDVLMLSTLAVSLQQQVDADAHAAGRMAIFGENPMDAFMREQSTKDFSPADARKWWHDRLQQQLNATYNLISNNRAIRDNPETENKLRESLGAHIDELGSRANNITDVMNQLDEAPYFHLGRYGNFFVGWKVKNAEAMAKVADKLAELGFEGVISDGTDKLSVFMRVEDRTAQNNLDAAVREFAKQGLVDISTIRSGQRTKNGFTGGFVPQAMQAAIAEIEASKMDDDAKEISKQELMARMIDLMPEMSLARVLTKRRNIPGYSPDMMRSFDWRAQVGINALAGMVTSPKITQSFVDMRGALDEAEIANIKDVPLEQRRGMRDILDEYSRRERERANWPETHVLDQIKGISSAWFLGASVSYGFVNMTQLGATLWPELGAKHGFVDAAKAIAKATPLAFKIMAEVAKHGKEVSLSRAMDAVITHDVLAKVVGKDMTEYLMRVVNTGNLDIGGPSRELIRSAEGRGDGGIDQVLRYASSVGYYTETASRLIAAIAVKQLNPKMSIEQAADQAAYTLNETMWNYSRTNQGREFGKMGILGRYTPLATQFLQYQAQLTEKLIREVYSAIKGETAAERTEARRYLAGHLAAMTVLAGTLGLPTATFLATVFDKLKDLWDDDDEPSDIRAAYRNWLASLVGKDAGEIIAHGGFRAAGFDISQRIGEQDLVPFSKFLADRRNFKDKAKDLALQTWGAPTSAAAGIFQGGEAMAEGNIMDGLTKMLPNALAAPVKAYKLTSQGYVDAAGKKLPMSSGATDVLIQALGFNPAAKAEYNEARQHTVERRGELTRKASVIRDQLAKAIMSGDEESAREMVTRAQAFDRANPSFAVLPNIGDVLRRRARAEATARASGTPLGVDPKDFGGQRLTAYANY